MKFFSVSDRIKLSSRWSALFALLLVLALPVAAQEEFKPIFNGKDLSGWEGSAPHWKVEKGEIVGSTVGNPTKKNTFLIYRSEEVGNFHLKAKLRMTGENNSGIMYRAQDYDKYPFGLSGPQMDIHPKIEFQGMHFSERTGRGIIAERGQKVVVPPELDDDGKPTPKVVGDLGKTPRFNFSQWNDYEIIAFGNRSIHKINGMVTVDVEDRGASISLRGLIGFQLHAGPEMTVYVKDVGLRDLEETEGRKAIEEAMERHSRERKKQLEVGQVVNENRATPVDKITVAEGFKVELLYSVPGDTQGSWINLALDGKNRLIASDQFGGLYRFPAPVPGEILDPSLVEEISVDMKAANGMLWAFDSLYVAVNDYRNKERSGLYRITDTDGDDALDHVELLRKMKSRGDHGVHGLRLSPDGEFIFLICGNYAELTDIDSSRVPTNWGEDHLLPRMPDGIGHNTNGMAPGGMVYKISPDGSKWELYSIGYRNIFDADFNADGELFTYDADMEGDFNTPWYRPTRVNHVVSGSDYGWRNGTGKWAEWYVDSVPPTLNIGPGSPTGVTFGYGAKFPARYQNALFIQDWSWGKLYAVTLEPEGSSYTGEKEEFISGVPLPMTDMVIHPDDGALYFTIGGRLVQSGLYRVTYVGNEDTSPVVYHSDGQEARDLRKRIEAFHGRVGNGAVELAWSNLDHDDPFMRNAARVALESQPVGNWVQRTFAENDPGKTIPALLALARVRGIDPFHRKASDPPVDKILGERILQSLGKLDYGSLSERHRQALVRTYQVTLNRFGQPRDVLRENIIWQLDPHFPAKTLESNRLLCETLVYLQAPNAAAKGVALLNTANTQEEQVEYARSLRMLTYGWTNALRVEYFEWFLKAANYRGGGSFANTLKRIRFDAVASLSNREKEDLAELLAREAEIKSPLESAMSSLAGRTKFTHWTLDDLSDAGDRMTGRDFDRGRALFAGAACYSCHRFNNEGGATGPDLSSAGRRYSPRDFLDQIINPSKEINEQYVPIQVTMLDGTVYYGVIVNLEGDRVQINTDLADPAQRIQLDRTLIKSMDPSPVSPMPPTLLGLLEKDEIFDLVAYVLSGGNLDDERFRK